MFNSFKQILPIILVALLIFSGLSAMGMSPQASTIHTGNSPAIVYRVPVYIENNLSVATPAPFDEKVVVNSSQYSLYENANLSNVVFMLYNYTVVPSWLQSGNSNAATNTTYWLRINTSIQPGTIMTVYMSMVSTSSFVLNRINTGEAPGLSATYGQFDDGFHVFPLYDNFAGTTLNTSKWNTGGSGNVTVDNGISFSSDSYITSTSKYASPAYADAYGIMNSPSSNSSTTFFLGGVGFGNGSIDGVLPVVTSGWTEGNVNGLGMSLWNITGPYYFGIPKSISPSSYHVFGTGYISGDHLTTTINGTIENSTNASIYALSYNVVLGFQSGDFPTVNHFSWIREIPALSNGMNIPFTLKGYAVKFQETGLPSGSNWILHVQGLNPDTVSATYFVNNSTSMFPNGTYSYNLSSVNHDYKPVVQSGTFTVSGSAITVNCAFEPVDYNISLYASGLPAGTSWSANVSGITYSSTGSLLNISLINGTYNITIYNANGYQPYPSSFNFSISGTSVSYGIAFESPRNQSYASALMTIFPGEQNIYPGYYLNTGSPAYADLGMAIDQNAGLMFNTMLFAGIVTVTSLGSGKFLNNITFGSYSYPLYPLYDSNNGYLYVALGNGSIAMVNTGSMSVTKIINAPLISGTFASIVQSATPDILYSVFFDYNNNTPAVYSFYTNGTMIGINYFSAFSGPLSGILGNPVAPAVYGNDILTFNGSDVIVFNMTAGTTTFIPVPFNYDIWSMVPYGTGGTYILGNNTGNTVLVFNPANMSIYRGVFVAGFVSSGFYDSLNGYEYLQVYSYSEATITVMNPGNGSVIATAPDLIPSISLVFDSSNQNMYSQDLAALGGKYSDGVHVYSTLKVYPVTFSENGLPAGSMWYVNVSGQASSGPISAGSTYTVELSNGMHSYTIGTGNKIFSSPGSAVTVSGAPMLVTASFSPVTYNVTFTESGLPAGTEWYVNISGSSSLHSTAASISVELQNGTYTYTLSTADKLYSPASASGTFTVNGSQMGVSAIFHFVNYTATFSETGLPAGTEWFVNISGGHHLQSSSSTLTAELHNGTYTYTVSTADSSYALNASSGTLTVNGKAVTATVQFHLVTYTVTFRETGLKAGSSWSVDVKGVAHTSNTSAITFQLANGTYTYSIGNESGYGKINGTSTFNVSGSGITIEVGYRNTGISTGDIAIIAGVVIVSGVAAGGATFYLRKRGSKP